MVNFLPMNFGLVWTLAIIFLQFASLSMMGAGAAEEPAAVSILVPQQPAPSPISVTSSIWTCDAGVPAQAKYVVYCDSACGENSCRINKNNDNLFCQCGDKEPSGCSDRPPTAGAEAPKCGQECGAVRSEGRKLVSYYCSEEDKSAYCVCAPAPAPAPAPALSQEEAVTTRDGEIVHGPLYDIIVALAPILLGPLFPITVQLSETLRVLLGCAIERLF